MQELSRDLGPHVQHVYVGGGRQEFTHSYSSPFHAKKHVTIVFPWNEVTCSQVRVVAGDREWLAWSMSMWGTWKVHYEGEVRCPIRDFE